MMKKKKPQISLLVPWRPDKGSPDRAHIWKWLRQYWEYELPDAEIVLGHSRGKTFSKTEAINNAARKAKGRIFVILDADTYMYGHEIQLCADRIDKSLARGIPLWLIPYRHLYRINQETTAKILASDPRNPLRLSSPPDPNTVESTLGSMHGHRFGAMIQIMPREAFETVGCMDPRFRGWGGEDIAFVRALDTLYAKHKTLKADVLHMWHKNVGNTHETRMWAGQDKPRVNEELASRYNKATGDRIKMRALVDEGCCQAKHCGVVKVSWQTLVIAGLMLFVVVLLLILYLKK